MRPEFSFRAPTIAAGVVIALLAASPAAAQWSSDPATNLAVCVAPQGQYMPALVPSVDGGSIVVWDDLRSGFQVIYGQRFDAAGFSQWMSNGLALAVAPGEMSAVSDGSGGVILAWFDSQSPPIALHAQRFAPDGTAQWTVGGTIVTNSGFGYSPYVKMVSDGAGGADIVWSTSFGPGVSRLYAQRIDGAGQPMWSGPVSVSTDTTLGSRPQVDTDDAGGVVIAWTSYRGVVYDVYAQRIDAVGTPLWGAQGVTVAPSTTFSRIRPGVARDAGGGAVVVWSQFHTVAAGARVTVSRPDLFAQRIDGTGAIQWAPDGVPLTLGTANGAYEDSVCADGAGGAYVSYPGDSIRVQHLTGAGLMPWGAAGLSVNKSNGYFWHPIVPAPDGGVIATWISTNLLSAQAISPAGQLHWGPQGVMVSTATGYKTYPAMLADPYGGATFVWLDGRNDVNSSNPDLYAQHVNAGGTLDVPVPPEPPHTFALSLSSAPCPAQAGAPVQLRFALPANGRVRLVLYDVSGRMVRTLVDGNEAMGWRTADWDGRDGDGAVMPAGVYLVRLVSTSGVTDARVVRLR